MSTVTLYLAATPGGDARIGLGPLIIGIVIVIGFIVARVYYARRKRQEPPVPEAPQPRSGAWQTPEEEGGPVSPNHGPGHQDGPEPTEYENVTREAEEVEPGPRRTPEHLRSYPGPRTG